MQEMVRGRISQAVLACALLAFAVALIDAAPAVTLKPDTLVGQHGEIEVHWSGIPSPAKSDFVALHLAQGKRAYVKHENTAGAAEGNFKIQLLNWRQPYRLVYTTAAGAVVAQATLSVKATTPTQIHIAKGELNGEMRITWVSGSNTTGSAQWGLEANNMTAFAPSTPTTYTAADLCEDKAKDWFINPGYMHTALLTELRYETTYFYRVGHPREGWSATLSFRTGPFPGQTTTSVVAFGDAGTATCQEMEGWCEHAAGNTYANIATDLTANKNLSLLLHIGDISYAVGWAHRWEQYFHDIQPIASQIPYMVSIGNHEYDYEKQPFKPKWSDFGSDSGGECGVPFGHRFHMPSGNGTKNLWYSFTQGNIQFVLMSAEHDYLVGSKQYEYLAKELASVNRKVTPWLVFAGHRPMYCSEAHGANSYIEHIRENLEPLLVKYNVDLALWGHVHWYERSCLINDHKCVANNGVVHLTIGMGGMGERNKPAPPVPAWVKFRDEAHYGYIRMDTNGNTMKVQYVINDGKAVLDQFTLQK